MSSVRHRSDGKEPAITNWGIACDNGPEWKTVSIVTSIEFADARREESWQGPNDGSFTRRGSLGPKHYRYSGCTVLLLSPEREVEPPPIVVNPRMDVITETDYGCKSRRQPAFFSDAHHRRGPFRRVTVRAPTGNEFGRV